MIVGKYSTKEENQAFSNVVTKGIMIVLGGFLVAGVIGNLGTTRTTKTVVVEKEVNVCEELEAKVYSNDYTNQELTQYVKECK